MGAESQTPDARVDELVGLLAEIAPKSLETLRQRLPQSRHLLRRGIIAGPTDSDLGAKTEITLFVLDKIKPIAEQMVSLDLRRTERHGMAILPLQLIVAVGTITIMATNDNPTPGAVLTQGLIAAAATASAGAQFALLRSLHNSLRESSSLYQSLLTTLTRLQCVNSDIPDDADVVQLISAANAHAARFRELTVARQTENDYDTVMSKEHALFNLLSDLFSIGSLRRLILSFPHGTKILSELPEHVSKSEIIHSACELLVQHGLIGDEFWKRVQQVRPYRSLYIERVKAMFNPETSPGTPQPDESGPPTQE